MPRIGHVKRAALDILDRLFFNQTCFFGLCERLSACDDDHPHALAVSALMALRQRVDEEVVASGESGVSAVALRHTVYCLLEARLDDNLAGAKASEAADCLGLVDHKGLLLSTHARALDSVLTTRLHEYRQTFFQAVITAMAEYAYGACTRTALAIADKIDAEELRDVPAVARYRLSERVFSLDFINAPAQFFSWMHRIGALTSQKFAHHWVAGDIPLEFKARVGLLCDFTLMRSLVSRLMGQASSAPAFVHRLRNHLAKPLSEQAWTQLHDLGHYFDRRAHDQERRSETDLLKTFAEDSFDLARLDDEGYLAGYLEYFAQNDRRSRFWTGPQHSWAGVIGAGMIRGYHLLVDPKRKITRNGNNHSQRAVLVEQDETVSENVCRVLKQNGLACRPGSLYETYQGSYMKHPAGLRHRAMLYHASLDTMDLAFPASYEDTAYLAAVVVTTR